MARKTRGEIEVEFLRGVLAIGGKLVNANFSVPGALDARNAVFHLTLDQHGVRALQEFSWSPELEEFLLYDLPTTMATPEEEEERFANILSHNLATAEAQYGIDFAQAIFVELVGHYPEYQLEKLLTKARAQPRTQSRQQSSHLTGLDVLGAESVGRAEQPSGFASYEQCRDFLQQAIVGLRNTASVALRYSNQPDLVKLIGGALGRVLADRFRVSRDESVPGR